MLPENSFHSMGDNTPEQPEKKSNSFQNSDQDLANLGDLESELSEPPEEPQNFNSGNTENLQQSDRGRVPPLLYYGQITYGANLISNRSVNSSTKPTQDLNITDEPSSLAQFTSNYVPQSHIHIVQTLRKLEANIDKKGDDEPNTLKQAIRRPDWPK